MRTNNRFLIFGLLIGLALGYLAGSTTSQWAQISRGFFDFNLPSLLNVFLTGTIAVFLTLMIRGQIEASYRRREIIGGFFDNLSAQSTSLWKDACANCSKRDSGLEQSIVNALKILSMSVTQTLKQTEMECGRQRRRVIHPLERKFLDFKRAVSDSPFGQKGPRYSRERKTRITEKYSAFLQEIQQMKITLYRD